MLITRYSKDPNLKDCFSLGIVAEITDILVISLSKLKSGFNFPKELLTAIHLNLYTSL